MLIKHIQHAAFSADAIISLVFGVGRMVKNKRGVQLFPPISFPSVPLLQPTNNSMVVQRDNANKVHK